MYKIKLHWKDSMFGQVLTNDINYASIHDKFKKAENGYFYDILGIFKYPIIFTDDEFHTLEHLLLKRISETNLLTYRRNASSLLNQLNTANYYDKSEEVKP